MNPTREYSQDPPVAMQENLPHWRRFLSNARAQARGAEAFDQTGRLVRITGLVMEATGLRLALGASCDVIQNDMRIEAEVVGFSGDRLFLMPVGDMQGLRPGALVRAQEERLPCTLAGAARLTGSVSNGSKQLPAGEHLLGRVLDAAGEPLDGLGPLVVDAKVPLQAPPINPIQRAPVTAKLDVGVRAINALLTVGRGQRLGLFAGSGVGKSVLIGMMARFTSADVIIVGLIGERGREVKDFIENILGPEGLQRAIVVAAPADTAPLMRVQGAAYATALAEYFRDQGRDVLLIMDSLTRFAMASREIALAVGEPPATKGYPPSVFARLPQLIERAGNAAEGGGSITAFYTVLTEGDDQQDPVADHARAILDGHIVLTRDLAEQGHYPAIDIEASISRVMSALATPAEMEQARQFKRLYSRYRRGRDLLSVGAYQPGADPVLDQAIALHPRMEAMLQQTMHESADLHASAVALDSLFPLNSPQTPQA
ncbi:MAG: flagellar protein export ATPase FliI [Burkholderiales bacterium]|nr:flagellar protein export ATPase FliI [Burkholderiales bacterium]